MAAVTERVASGLVKALIIQKINFDEAPHKNLIANIARKLCSNYKFDEINGQIFKHLLWYFNGDEKFEKEELNGENYSLEKGILLNGPVGTGKSLIMKIFREYLITTANPNYFDFATSREIMTEFDKNGFWALDQYITKNCYKDNPNYPKTVPNAICIDDLGNDEVLKRFGNTFDPITEIIFRRYENFQRTGRVTHATTNLDSDQIKQTLGDKITSRMREMFNIITLGGEDRRK